MNKYDIVQHKHTKASFGLIIKIKTIVGCINSAYWVIWSNGEYSYSFKKELILTVLHKDE